MRLSDYLKARRERGVAFALRADLPQRTVADVVQGGGCHISTAHKIVEASRREPAPDGGTVTYEDLLPRVADAAGSPAPASRRARAAAGAA
jgi:hypothetical protein